MIPVTELFGPTVQGEGIMTGTITHFLRTGGCPLRCSWCDSLDSVLPERVKATAERLQPSDILERISGMPYAPWITFTGGDPCMHKQLGDIIPALNGPQFNMKVAIETQGTLFPDWLPQVDVVTFSPKPPSSGNEVDIRQMLDWIQTYASPQRQICVKVVVNTGAPEDLDYALRVYAAVKPQLIQGFWFNACSPVYPQEALATPLFPGIRSLITLELYQELTEMLLSMAREQQIAFHDRTHIGCQQHVLLWPNADKGV